MSNGSNNGNVTRVPRTDPFVRLKAFPKLKTLINIYDVMSKIGKILIARFPELVKPKQNKDPIIDIGTPINSQ